jgi:hypothetical protein
MNKSLWIFDYDQTLMPSYISNIIINKRIINSKDINEIVIILINIVIIINNIINSINGEIIILTASIEPWVNTSLKAAEKLIFNNKQLIDYDKIKGSIISYNYDKIRRILNTDGFFTIFFEKTLKNNIYYVHNIESKYGYKSERFNKNISLNFLIHKYNKYNNIIILGDSRENERKYAIEIAKEIAKKKYDKKIKFIQFYNTNDNLIKIHEQHLLFYNLKIIHNTDNSVIFDINE